MKDNNTLPDSHNINWHAEYCESLNGDEFNSYFDKHLLAPIQYLFKTRFVSREVPKEEITQDAYLDIITALKKNQYSSESGEFLHWCHIIFSNCRKRFSKIHKRKLPSISDLNIQHDDNDDTLVRGDRGVQAKNLEETAYITTGSFTEELRSEMDAYSQWYEMQKRSSSSSHYPSEIWIWLRNEELSWIFDGEFFSRNLMVTWHSNENQWRFKQNWPCIEDIAQAMQNRDFVPDSNCRILDDLLDTMIKKDSANWYNQRDQHRTRARATIKQCHAISQNIEFLKKYFCDQQGQYHANQKD